MDQPHRPKVEVYKAKGKTPEELAEERKENIIALSLVILLLAGAGWWIYSALTAPAPQPDIRVNIPIGVSPMLGTDAPVTVVLFSDFQCPYCAQFALESFPHVRERFIETGQVRFAYKHYPLPSHADAPLAAQASLCAHDQDRFWEYHDTLYAKQDALGVGDLQQYALDLGLDMERFRSCLLNQEHAGDVARDRTVGQQLGVTGTPTFFFNGRRVVGALTAEEFAAEVLRELSAS